MSEKTCYRCKKTLGSECFNVATRNKDKLASYCRECHKIYYTNYVGRPEVKHRQKEWINSNKERSKAIKKKYYQNNKEKIKQKTKECAMFRKYGITYSQYENARISQNFCCLICRRKELDLSRQLYIDHIDTAQGPIFRGLLCLNCNVGLGAFQENSGLLMRASEYVRKT